MVLGSQDVEPAAPPVLNQTQSKTRGYNHPQAISEKYLVKLRGPLRGLDELPVHPARGLLGFRCWGLVFGL